MTKTSRSLRKITALLLGVLLSVPAAASQVSADIAATHVYHNHMPNFWAYYDLNSYNAAPIGSPIRYTYDGEVIALKQNPPRGILIFCLVVPRCPMMIWSPTIPITPRPERT